MCMKVAIENIHHITSLGDLPTEYVYAVLRAVKTANHLVSNKLASLRRTPLSLSDIAVAHPRGQ